MDFTWVLKGFAMYRAMSLKSAMMLCRYQHRWSRAGGEQPDPDATLDREITLPSSGTTLISLVAEVAIRSAWRSSPSPTA